MIDQHRNLLTLGFVLLLLALSSLYIYKDLKQSGSVPVSVVKEEKPPKSEVAIETDKPAQNYKVTVVDGSKVFPKAPKAPDLSLPAVNYSHIEEAAFTIAAQNIAETAKNLQKDSMDEFSWLKLGIYRKMLGDYKAAADIWSYTAAVWPKDYISYNNLADLYQSYIKDYPLAEKNWLKVIDLKPDYPQAYENLYDLYTLSYKDKQDQALSVILKGLEQSPKSIDLMVYIARHYRTLGDKDSALTYYGKAAEQARLEKNDQLETSLRSEASELKK